VQQKSKSKKAPGTYGAYRRNFPASVRWRVDQDYLEKLSPSERQWLAQFNDRYYGADFRGDTEQEWSNQERRAAFVAKNTANGDLGPFDGYVRPAKDELQPLDCIEDHLDSTVDEQPQNSEPTPEYLSSPAYKQARDEFRALLAPGRKPLPPARTPAFEVAQKRLKALTPTNDE